MRTPFWEFIFLVPLGCASSSVDDETTGGNAPWDDVADLGPDGEVDLDAVGAAIQGIVDQIYRWDARPVLVSYEQATSDRDDLCPPIFEADEGPYWETLGCETEGGTFYVGQVQNHTVWDTYFDEQVREEWFDALGPQLLLTWDPADWDELVLMGEGLSGGAEIVEDNEQGCSLGGEFFYLYSQNQGLVVYVHELHGTFEWSGSATSGSWMEQALTPNLTITHMTMPSTGVNLRHLEGAIGGIEGAYDTVDFRDVMIAESSLGTACELEPGGVIAVRSTQGHWYDIAFDGPTALGEAAMGPCDGCGTGYSGGEAIGEVCVDFASLLADYDSVFTESP